MKILFLVSTILNCVFEIDGANNNQCGISTNIQIYDGSDQTRILGGKRSNPAEWPFIVQTKLKDKKTGKSGLCTGTIIGDRWVLSAAHCQENGGPAQVIIRGKTYDAEPVMNNENYNSQTNVNDIQLIKLKQPIQFTRDVSNVCLFRNVSAQNGDMAVAAGYGVRFNGVKDLQTTFQKEVLDARHDIDFKETSDLYETPLTIRNFDFCNVRPETTTNRICAGGQMTGTSQGDSGGPLLVVRNGRWVQVGITSDGTYKAVKNDVTKIIDRGMYTQVSAYCNWIETKTSGEVKCQ
uniref:Peptidase S1 domain-containing protein n=1 Tax=Panagrolaimus davidi TaxID=227884 RepID=A0A914P594_9BILA